MTTLSYFGEHLNCVLDRTEEGMLSRREQQAENEKYLQSELGTLGIECKRKNEFNDKEELEALATAVKEVYFQDYKTAYNDSHIEIDKSHFDYII